jgi:signal transduction histidine kinase
VSPGNVARRIRPASAGRVAFYRLLAVSATEAPADVARGPASTVDESPRVAEARVRAGRRLERQRSTLRPLGIAVIVVVVASTLAAHPAPGTHGKGIGVALALLVFIATLGAAIRGPFTSLSVAVQVAVIASMGAAGVALGGLQPRGATELAGGAAVWTAIARLPLALGAPLAVAITVALDVVAAVSGSSAASVIAGTLLCVLLGVMAYFMKQARESQDRTELLLAQLEDAREEQARAAAIAERGRIASELHDVLAHSLSGAAIQLQTARMVADRDQTAPRVRSAIDRASELVKDGLADARQAVGALRGDELPTVAQLPALVASFREDTGADVSISVEGSPRPLAADAGLALYRGAQEALTNAARYAPGATTTVVLRYEAARTRLTVEDRATVSAGAGVGLTGVGGGRGLAGMRERIERAGGSMSAGPTSDGWRVELEVPA